MEMWFMIIVSISIAALLKAFIDLFKASKTPYKLPPGPFIFPIIGNFLLLRKSLAELEPYIQSLHSKLGPIVTLNIGSNTTIFIADRSLAHQALIQNGAAFADRPSPTAVGKITTSNQHNINSAAYGPTWRLLRRNLTAEILHPSRMKSYSHARNWVLQILKDRLDSQSKSGGPVLLVDHLQFVMFGLLVLMCFGDKLDEKKIKQVEDVQRRMLINSRRFNILNFWPRLTKFVFRNRWQEFWKLRNEQTSVYLSLIRERKKIKEEKSSKDHDDQEYVMSYLDTLFDMQLPVEKRKLDEREIISLCSEFLTAGTDATSTALQWVMANLVKHPNIQEKVLEEIERVVENGAKEVKEDDLQKLPYLKAVILESLRRHPPAHFVVPHAVTEDMVLNGHLIPKNASINFMVADMGMDSKVWEAPTEFKPERFVKSEDEKEGQLGFDITGSREIKMMPFGVGRRICPGLGLAMLHLEYFVANLVWCYQWKAVEGDEIALEEKHEFTMVMKTPLQAHIIPRST